MVNHRKPTLAVVGSSSPTGPSLDMARELGRRAVLAGYSVVCGGLGGVMAAASEGAQQGKREILSRGVPVDLPQVVAILPVADRSAANPYADLVIPSGLGYARNLLVVLSADGVVAVEGGSGTLSEIANAWQLGKPVVALGPSGGWAGRLAGRALDGKRSDVIQRAETPEEAVAMLRRSALGA